MRECKSDCAGPDLEPAEAAKDSDQLDHPHGPDKPNLREKEREREGERKRERERERSDSDQRLGSAGPSARPGRTEPVHERERTDGVTRINDSDQLEDPRARERETGAMERLGSKTRIVGLYGVCV